MRKRFVSTLCICLATLLPATTFAAEVTSKYFTVGLTAGAHTELLSPGDTFHDTFYITNSSEHNIAVRLNKVENVEASSLFPAIEGKWSTPGEETTYVSLASFTSDWFILTPNQSKRLDLDLHFGENMGNEYQGASLNARFVFEANLPDNINNPASTPNGPTFIKNEDIVISRTPKTGDRSISFVCYFPAIIAAIFLIWVQFQKVRMKSNERTLGNAGFPDQPNPEPPSRRSTILNWAGTVLTVFLVLIAIYCVTGVTCQKKTGDMFFPFGYRGVKILSGSMEDTLHAGTLVLVKKTKEVEEGDIIFFVTGMGTPVVHRYVATTPDGSLVTKGDNNPKEDLEPVTKDRLQGKVVIIF